MQVDDFISALIQHIPEHQFKMIRHNKRLKENIAKRGALLPLVNKPRCYSFSPADGCLYCNNKTFRHHSTSHGKKYYQCEKCSGINH